MGALLAMKIPDLNIRKFPVMNRTASTRICEFLSGNFHAIKYFFRNFRLSCLLNLAPRASHLTVPWRDEMRDPGNKTVVRLTKYQQFSVPESFPGNFRTRILG